MVSVVSFVVSIMVLRLFVVKALPLGAYREWIHTNLSIK